MNRSRRALHRFAIPAAVLGIIGAMLLAATPALAGRPSLDAAMAALDRAITFSGAAYGVDTVANQVRVTVDSSVTGTRLAAVRSTVAGLGTAVRLERVAGTFRLDGVRGGEAIYGTRYRCSLGFNVKSGSTFYFLTAGHCGKAEKTWWSSTTHNTSTLLGNTVNASFPGNDFALVQYASSYYSQLDAHTIVRNNGGSTTISAAAEAYVTENVARDGSTTGTHTGSVTALNVTVRYQGGGVVRGLIQTTVCAEPGDSGGPLFDGTLAIGLTSGGSGDCKKGGTTFFQPVTEALSVYGVDVY
jgi:S1-C subfamily serine protease